MSADELKGKFDQVRLRTKTDVEIEKLIDAGKVSKALEMKRDLSGNRARGEVVPLHRRGSTTET